MPVLPIRRQIVKNEGRLKSRYQGLLAVLEWRSIASLPATSSNRSPNSPYPSPHILTHSILDYTDVIAMVRQEIQTLYNYC